MACSTTCALRNAAGCQDRAGQPVRLADRGHRGGAGLLGAADTVGVGGGDGGRAGQGHAQRLRDAGHRARGAHHHAGARRGGQAAVDLVHLRLGELAGAMPGPEPAAIGAGAQHLALVVAHQHRPGDELHAGDIQAGSGHQLRGDGLVAAADHQHRVHRLGAAHLLRVDGGQVAEEHGGRVGEALVDRHRRERHRQTARQHDATLGRLHQRRHVAVTGIVGAGRVHDADDRAGQRIVRIAHRLYEGPAQEQAEPVIAVAGQSLAHPCGHRACFPDRV